MKKLNSLRLYHPDIKIAIERVIKMMATSAAKRGKACCNGCGSAVGLTKIGDVVLCPQCINRAAILTGIKAS